MTKSSFVERESRNQRIQDKKKMNGKGKYRAKSFIVGLWDLIVDFVFMMIPIIVLIAVTVYMF